MLVFRMMPYLEIFLGITGFGLCIMFCITFCRACTRFREEQIEREVARRAEHDGQPRSIYVIPFPRSMSRQNSESSGERGSTPPRYSTAAICGPPPAYNEVFQQGCKPDDPPPAYTEQNIPVYSIIPPHHSDAAQSRP